MAYPYSPVLAAFLMSAPLSVVIDAILVFAMPMFDSSKSIIFLRLFSIWRSRIILNAKTVDR